MFYKRNLSALFETVLSYRCNWLLTGPEAKKLFDDAQGMLNEIIEKKLFRPRGVVAFYPANSSGEDINVTLLSYEWSVKTLLI